MNKEKFGDTIKKRRQQLTLTKWQCASQFNVSVNTYTSWENGLSEPRQDKFKLVCTFFDLSETMFV